MTSISCTSYVHQPPIYLTNLQLILGDALNRHQLSLKDQHRISRNRTRTPRSIRPIRLNRQLPLLARAHVQQSLIPALDDLALSDTEAQRLTAVVRCVEFAAVFLKGAAVVYVDHVTGDSLAGAFDWGCDFGFEVLLKRNVSDGAFVGRCSGIDGKYLVVDDACGGGCG